MFVSMTRSANLPEEVLAYLAKYPHDLDDLGTEVLDIVLSNFPDLTVKMAWRTPFVYGQNPILYVNPKRKEKCINVGFYRGVELSESFPELVGDGLDQVRHLVCYPDQEIPSILLKMVERAIEMDNMPHHPRRTPKVK